MTRIDWAGVAAGDILLGKDGAEWGVLDVGTAGVKLQRVSDGKATLITPRPSGRVQRVRTASEQTTMAAGLVADRLGGRLTGTQVPGRPWRVPARWFDPAALAGHIHLMHAEDSSWKMPAATGLEEASSRGGAERRMTRAQLVEAHQAMHDPGHPLRPGHIPHEHDPDFYEERPW